MGLKKRCSYCSGRVKEPKEGESTACSWCGAPGPWATDQQQAAHRQLLAERAADQEAAADRERYDAEMRRYRQLLPALELVPVDAPGFVAQKSEEVYVAMPARLAEWKKERGHYEGGGGIRGLSVRVPGTKTMRAYYGGLSQRRYLPGEEAWRVTDEGSAVVTSKRIVFRGQTKNVEWTFAKLVGLDLDQAGGTIQLQVTNRQASHLLNPDDVTFFYVKVVAALARFRGEERPTLPAPERPAALPETGGLPAPPLRALTSQEPDHKSRRGRPRTPPPRPPGRARLPRAPGGARAAGGRARRADRAAPREWRGARRGAHRRRERSRRPRAAAA